MNITQKQTDVASIAVGVVTSIAMLAPHALRLALGGGVSGFVLLTLAIIAFGWISMTKTWRNTQMRQMTGITPTTQMKNLYLVAGISAAVWLIMILTFTNLLLFIVALVVVSALREIGFRQAEQDSRLW